MRRCEKYSNEGNVTEKSKRDERTHYLGTVRMNLDVGRIQEEVGVRRSSRGSNPRVRTRIVFEAGCRHDVAYSVTLDV